MRKRWTPLLVTVALFALPAFGQRLGPFSFTANSQCFGINTSSIADGTVAMDVAGTWSATLQAETIIAGQAPQNSQVVPGTAFGTPASTITTNGRYYGPATGVDKFQVCTTAYTSGTAVIYFNVSHTSSASLFGGGGGGGLGTVTSVSGTANQISVTSPTTTPVLALTNPLITPGPLAVTGGTLTTDVQPFKVTWTYNNVSQVFNGVEFVCTNTASAVGSFCLQALGGSAGTTALLQLDTAGDLTAAGTVTGNILASAGSGAGSMQLSAGVLPSLTGSSAGFTAPTSVGTAYSLVLPSAGPSGASVLEFGAVSGGFSTGSFVAAGSSFANTALSNLASVSINTALLAQTGVDLGSTTAPFRNVYIFGSGTFASDYIEFTGTPSTGDVATFPDNTGTVGELNFAQTWSAAQTFSAIGNFSAAGAASTPGLRVTGAPYTGGNSTTNFPQFYVNDGTGPSTFSLNGTEIGINAPSSFTGNLLDAHINGGASIANLSYLGTLALGGATPPTTGTGGGVACTEGTNPTAASSSDQLSCDSTLHDFAVNANGGVQKLLGSSIGYNSGSRSSTLGSTNVASSANFPTGQYILNCDVAVTAVGSAPTLAVTIGWTDITGTARTKTCTTGVVTVSDNPVTQTITSNGSAAITVTQTLAVSTATWWTTVAITRLQ